jgi:hypothetical protein
MRKPVVTVAAVLIIVSLAGPAMTHAGSKSEKKSTTSSTRSSDDWARDPQQVDEWATHALAHPESDWGWGQNLKNWDGDWVSTAAVRELPYPRDGQPIAIDGGDNGGMTVVGWDRNEIRVLYRVVARARNEAGAKELAESVHINRVRGRLVPDGPATKSGTWWSTEVRIWVPRASDLSLRTMNGPLGVENVKGTMDLESTNGPVSLVDLSGAVEARLDNGPLHVALEGTRWDGAGLDATSLNGPVNFVVPTNYSARIETGTISGPSSIQYALETNRYRGGHIVTTLGSGGPPVRVTTDNGPFHMASR